MLHIRMSHVTSLNVSRDLYDCVVSRKAATSEVSISATALTHYIKERVVQHIGMRRVTHLNESWDLSE